MPEPGPPGSDDPAPPSAWRDRLDLLVSGAPLSPARLALGVAGLVVLAAVGLAVWRAQPGPPPELSLPVAGSNGDPASTTTTAPSEVLAHAAGAVQRPGVYRLAPGARASDLIDAAGGAAEGADLNRLNLAAVVSDGQRLYVPRAGEAIPAVEGGAGGDEVTGGAGSGGGERVNVNTASAEQLDSLPGVGPATAEAILAERERRGRFGSVEELIEVRGIGEAKLEQLRDLVSV